MGESKRRKAKDPNYGKVPKNACVKPTTIFISFYKLNGRIYANNHSEKKDDLTIALAKQCVQYKEDKGRQTIDWAISELENKSDGHWMFNTEKGWRRLDCTFVELMEISQTDPSARELINFNTQMGVGVFDGYFNANSEETAQAMRELQEKSKTEGIKLIKLIQQKIIEEGFFGTLFIPEVIRMAVAIKSQEDNFYYCQTLTDLNKYKIPKKYFYPQGHPLSLMALDVQIKIYKQIEESDRELAYQNSELVDLSKYL